MLAAASYFWRDMADMAIGLVRFTKGKRHPGASLVLRLALATLVAGSVALLVMRYAGDSWRTPAVTAWAAFGAALLLLLFDHSCMTVKRIEHASYLDAVILGLAEALALVPGVGRIVITAAIARALGYERPEAARFAFLLSIPLLAASSGWLTVDILAEPGPFPINQLVLGLGLAFATGMAALAILMAWLRRHGFAPFAVYRALIGANLVAIVYGWL
jgi:undecaprenyl-diphosphatase